jgi:enoyl-CoA hydratase
MTGYDFLQVSTEGGVVSVTLDRPPVNAVSQAMYRELRACFATLGERYPTAKVAVVRGAGRHFCAGNDKDEFAAMTPDNAASRMREVREAFAAIYECPIPTVAVVTGAALGTGAVIAACCDVVIADEEARLGAPEVGVGVMGGGRHLARLVGEGPMRSMYFTAAPVRAAELSCIRCVPRDRLEEVVSAHVAQIARHSAVVLRYAKQSLNRSEYLPLKAAYEVEQEYTVWLAATADSAEARAALAAGRLPVYPATR